MDNYASVVHQMEAFGVQFLPKDLPLAIPTPKRKTCGKGGKWWYWLQLFRPRAGGEYVVGKFGTYKHGGSDAKVDVDWKPLSEAEKARFRAEQHAAAARAKQVKEEAAAFAAMSAADQWARARRAGESPYLKRKGVQAEACRFLADGTLLIPLLRYDLPRDQALRAVQRIHPDGTKLFTKGFAKNGCCLRLGEVDASTRVLMVCEGYATGLSIRVATGRRRPVFVALDAYNLVFVVEILRRQYPAVHLLVCADDDWKSADQDGANPGRAKAKAAAKATPQCDLVWPVFDADLRQPKDTDFNDLHLREGLEAVEQQLLGVISAIEKGWGRGR